MRLLSLFLRKCNLDLILSLTLSHTSLTCKDRLLQQALDLFSSMKTKGIKPNVVTYTSLIRGLYNSGCGDEAQRVLTEMLESNIAPNIKTYSMLVDMFCKDGCVDQAQSILKHMIEIGVPPNILTYSI
ncbi:pentatricopeptide repeat-containing protein At1g62680, mitochondrial-like [Chenopodium quinoa]|uniref:pentatricopeptide repeat-containing protein At1g62680, mitochondrial-like n=1 Tax=Chenopodium quinoa TaxID=63459 RepID=UPI000B78FDE1|nr:pentatricopeptide repeat-containing protein At1g62680, mitochondrial-like [Chenopodium quinoa]